MRRSLNRCAVVLASLALTSLAWAFEPSSLAGLPLERALDLLRADGLAIVSSSALVRDDMVVAVAPAAGDARAALAEILAAHGLAVLPGPHGLLVVVAAPTGSATAARGAIAGRVLLAPGSATVRRVVVRVVEQDRAVEADADGSFVLTDVPAGSYRVEAAALGSQPVTVSNVAVRDGVTTPLLIQLDPASVFLSEIVVTPSHFRVLATEPESRTFLSGDDLTRLPRVADDLFRVVERLPGTAAGDASAAFHVRGGEERDLLVLLDGVELYEPFHLKDFQNVFSVVDAAAVGGVDVLTGSFPVEYGGRMGGVMDIATASPSGPPRTAVALSLFNARVTSQGSFDGGGGQWLVSGRAWYPDAIAGRVSETADEIITDYYDLLLKLQVPVGERSVLAVNALAAFDDLGFTDLGATATETVAARYESHQEWLSLRTDWSERLYSETVLSAGTIERRRIGSAVDPAAGALAIHDRRGLNLAGLTQSWSWELGDRHLAKGGLELRRERATYDYRRTTAAAPSPDGDEQVEVVLGPSGTSYAAFVADRFRLLPELVLELGLRWDRQSYVGARQLSPRANLRWDARPRTTVRLGWGRFTQPQRLNEVQVEDGVSELYPAQLAEHSLLSLEQRFAAGLAVRVELYNKHFSELQPRFENLFDPLELFPEAAADRVEIVPDGGRARGLELLVQSARGNAVEWWASYALSTVEDRVDGAWVPRSWDQRHALAAGLAWRLGSYELGLAASWHSGWPITAVLAADGPDPVPVLGPRNGERLPAYFRLDARASRSFATDHGEVALFVDVINLSNRENACCREDFAVVTGADGQPEVSFDESYWVPIVPSLGVSWTF